MTELKDHGINLETVNTEQPKGRLDDMNETKLDNILGISEQKGIKVIVSDQWIEDFKSILEEDGVFFESKEELDDCIEELVYDCLQESLIDMDIEFMTTKQAEDLITKNLN